MGQGRRQGGSTSSHVYGTVITVPQHLQTIWDTDSPSTAFLMLFH